MRFFLGLLILFYSLNCFSQEPRKEHKQNSITLFSGIGFLATLNEHYDLKKYSGRQLPVGIEWEKIQEKNFSRCYAYYHSGNIQSGYDDADIDQLSLAYDYYILLKRVSLFRKKASLFAGPSAFIDLRSREQPGVINSVSFTHLNICSFGPNVYLEYASSDKLTLSTALGMNLLSYINQSGINKGLVLFNSGFISHNNIALDWQMCPHFNVGMRYQSDFYSIKKWETITSGSDLLLFTLNYIL